MVYSARENEKMTSDYSIVKCGLQQNKGDFVSVTKYAVILQSGKKYLVPQFYNELNEKLDELSFSITETDENGDVITERTVDFIGLDVNAKTAFGEDRKVMLSDGCCDVKIKVVGGVYGKFVRRRKADETIVDYKKKEKETYSDEKICDLANGKRHFAAALYRSDVLKTAIVAILAVIVACCAFLFYVNYFKSTENSFIKDGCEYEIVENDGEKAVELSRYRGYGGRAVIPERFDEYKVIKIRSGAFSGVGNLRSVAIAGNPTIEARAFEDFYSLQSLNLGGVTTLPDFAFRNCNSLLEVTSDKLETIGNKVFENCLSLQSVALTNENGVTFGESVFKNCYNLQSFELVADFKFSSKATDLFNGCVSMKNMSVFSLTEEYGYIKGLFGNTVPLLTELHVKEIKEIPKDFCSGYYSLAAFTVDSIEKPVIGDRAFLGCKALKTLSVPAQITSVGTESLKNTAISAFDATKLEFAGKEAFAKNSSLEKITLNDNFAVIPEGLFSGCGGLKQVTLPDTCKEISLNAFRGCSSLTRFNLPANLEIIGNYAFAECDSLKEFVVSPSVSEIGACAFSGCNSLASIELPYLGNSPDDRNGLVCIFSANGDTSEIPLSLKKVVLNGGSVYDEAFKGASSVERIVVNAQISSIGARAFSNCASLLNLTTSGDITSIGDGAFEYCKSLQRYEVPDSVRQIGRGVFVGCLSVKELTLPFLGASSSADGNVSYSFVGDYGQGTVPASLTKITVKGGKIGERAFVACSGLEEADLTGNFSSIGAYAFMSCYNLRSVTLPQTVKEIGYYAFSGCNNLSRIDLPDELRTIGANAFENCFTLKSITLPKKLITIGDSAFAACYHLYKVYNESKLRVVRGGENGSVGRFALAVSSDGKEIPATTYNNIEFTLSDDGFLYVTDYLGSSDAVSMPQYVTVNNRDYYAYKIADYLFFNSSVGGKLNFIEFGDAVTSIGEWAFYGCQGLTGIAIGRNVSRIGDLAFYGCGLLKNVDIPADSALTEIGSAAFAECSSLVSFIVPDLTTSVGGSAFQNCYSLKDVYFGKLLMTIEDSAFNGCSSLKAAVLPISVKSIGSSSFEGCSSMDKVEIFGKLRVLGSSAFSGCRSLTDISFDAENGFTVSDYAFFGCQSLQSLKLPDGTERIGEHAFENCSSLYVLNLPYGIKTIGVRAFACSSVQSLDIPQTTETIGGYAFASCERLTGLTVAAPYCAIGNNAFELCTSLKSAQITASRMYSSAFAGCAALEEARIESGLYAIPIYAFSDCTSLELIVLPATLAKIEDMAFFNCTSLYEIYNLSKLSLTCGGSGYGDVALNAYKIHSSMSESPMEKAGTDKVRFIRPDGDWTMVRCDNSAKNLTFGNFITNDGLHIDSYAIAASAVADTDAESVYFGKEVIAIAQNSFRNKNNLTSVEFDKDCTIREIPAYAFSQCYSLKRVVFCDSITTIGNNAFENDNLSQTEDLPRNLTTICKNAFAFTGLKCIILPVGLTKIETEAFIGCSDLVEIYNLSSLKIKAGETDSYGNVAANAVVVNTSLSVPRVSRYNYGEFSFLRFNDSWHLYKFNGYYTSLCVLPDASAIDEIDDYDILSRAFNFDVMQIVIPASVKAVAAGAFLNDSVYRAYYGGNDDQWKSLMKKSSFAVSETYFYADCVHKSYQWTYDAYGGVDSTIKEFKLKTKIEPTCTERGKLIYACPYCGEERIEDGGAPVGHVFVNGVCKYCQKKESKGKTNDGTSEQARRCGGEIEQITKKRRMAIILADDKMRRYA